MVMWTTQYPYKLAGLLAAPSQAETMKEFKTDVLAFWVAKA